MAQPIAVAAVTFLLILAAGPACDRDASGPAHGEGDVVGSVARVKTGVGVADLLVALTNEDGVVAAAATDETGAFRFDAVPRGSYTAHLTGFELAGVSPATTAFDPLERAVQVSDATEPVVFAAVGLFTQVEATVLCDGSPVPDVDVRVVGGAVDDTVVTTVLGEAAAPVEPGSYAVVVLDPPCALSPEFGITSVNQGQTALVRFEGGS